jgi:alpha-1,3-mannosyltransferase
MAETTSRKQSANLRGSTTSSSSSNKHKSASTLPHKLSSLYNHLALDSRFDTVWLVCLLLAEALLGLVVIHKVPYTEIDWEAYMQEVQIWQDGETDYKQIYGGTGPLVYPAGFLYLFAALKWATANGKRIRVGQYAFLFFYLATQASVMMLFQQRISVLRREYNIQETKKTDDETKTQSTAQQQQLVKSVWTWRIAMACLCLSKRLHSIYMLRLFNDGPTMMFLYISILLFTRNQWDLGCLVFSLAVSVKMNVLLFAPGLLLLLLQVGPDYITVIKRLAIFCAVPQVLLGWPFLTTYPVSYLRKAFELDRVFFYKWTVNLKFLPEDVFLSKSWAVLLLVLHLSGLAVCAVAWIQATTRQNGQLWRLKESQSLSSHYVVYTLLVSNFIGICFARTLHYQFYVSGREWPCEEIYYECGVCDIWLMAKNHCGLCC